MAKVYDPGDLTAPSINPSPATTPTPYTPPVTQPQAQPAAPYAAPAGVPGVATDPGVAQAAAAASSGYTGGTPQGQITFGTSYTPDYKALIETDPTYLLGKHNLELSHNLALQYAGMSGGSVAPLPSWVGNAFDETDPYSRISQLKRTHDQEQFQLPRQLAGRGMFTSSETPYALEQSDYSFGAGKHDLKQQVEDAQAAHAAAAANAAQASSMAQARAEIEYQQGQGNLYLDTYKALSHDPINRPVSPTQAFLIDGSTDFYGQPIYSDENGRLFTAEGKPYYSVKTSGFQPSPQQIQSASQQAAGNYSSYDPSDPYQYQNAAEYAAANAGEYQGGASTPNALAALGALTQLYGPSAYQFGYTGSTPMSSIDQILFGGK